MPWPSKDPDDYVGPDGRPRSGWRPEDRVRQTPARYRVLGALVGLAVCVPLSIAARDLHDLWLIGYVAGPMVADMWWQLRLPPAVIAGGLVGGIGAGCLVSAATGLASQAGLGFGALAGLGVVALLGYRYRRGTPAEPRPRPAPLRLPGVGRVDQLGPSKDPDDFV